MTNPLIEVSKTSDEQIRINIPEMPWWSGPQKNSISPQIIPFCLQSQKNGPIIQSLTKADEQKVLQIYEKLYKKNHPRNYS